MKYYIGKKLNHKKPIMDYLNMISAQRMYGKNKFFLSIHNLFLSIMKQVTKPHHL